MRTTMRADDDVEYLRNLLTPLDPAMPGRTPAPSGRQPRAITRRRSWAVAGLAAAAAVVAILAVTVPLLLAGGTAQAPAGGGAQAPADAPTARPSYDHVQWRDYQGTQLVDTVDWWWNGVDGRDLHRDASGAASSDVTLRFASAASDPVTPSATATPDTKTTDTASATASSAPGMATTGTTEGSADPNEAAGTPAPTSGTELTADDFPGSLPSTADGLAKYLADRHFPVKQAVLSIPFQRHLDARQMAALISLARSLGPDSGVVTLPDGQSALMLTFGEQEDGIADIRLVLTSSGTRILGTTEDVDGQTWWRLITVSELTATAN